MTTTPTPADRLRDRLAALLAHHTDILAATLRADAGTGLPEYRGGVDRAAGLLDLHAEHLTADEETPAVRELLDSILAFEAERPDLAHARQLLGTSECPECGTSGACNGGPCPLTAAAPPAPADRATTSAEWSALLNQAADRMKTSWFTDEATAAAAKAELRRLADEAAGVKQPTEGEAEAEPLTEEQVIREHVTTVHLIGEQLADVESWLWQRLADARDATPPAAPAATEEPTP